MSDRTDEYTCEWCGKTWIGYIVHNQGEYPTCSHSCSARLRESHLSLEPHYSRNNRIPPDIQNQLNHGIVYARPIEPIKPPKKKPKA